MHAPGATHGGFSSSSQGRNAAPRRDCQIRTGEVPGRAPLLRPRPGLRHSGRLANHRPKPVIAVDVAPALSRKAAALDRCRPASHHSIQAHPPTGLGCARRRRAPASPTVGPDHAGRPAEVSWISAGEDRAAARDPTPAVPHQGGKAHAVRIRSTASTRRPCPQSLGGVLRDVALATRSQRSRSSLDSRSQRDSPSSPRRSQRAPPSAPAALSDVDGPVSALVAFEGRRRGRRRVFGGGRDSRPQRRALGSRRLDRAR
jgi:hypothetical protein